MADKLHAEKLAEACNALADEQELIHLNSWVEIRNLFRASAAELSRLSAIEAATLTNAQVREAIQAEVQEWSVENLTLEQAAAVAIALADLARRLGIDMEGK